jgi:pyruvate dehydrogenase E1 component alpha subunit
LSARIDTTLNVQLVEDYRRVLLIRRFEEAVLRLRAEETIVGSVHLCIGQEAVAVGAVSARRPDDPVFATYRGHGWALACGVDPTALMAELCGRASGINGGRGGSAYFTAPSEAFYGENSIVGAGAPIAVGAALAAKQDGSGKVALVDFGEGAMNQGAVHEALNFASAFELPIVFICENNLYSELTPTASMVKDPVLVRRAAAYGIPGARIDGNDTKAVRESAAEAIDRARRGDGPSFIEAMTYRLVGHYIGDPETYRPDGELEAAYTSEPLALLTRRLTDAGLTDDLASIKSEIDSLIADAVAAAQSAPPADTSNVREHVYGDID